MHLGNEYSNKEINLILDKYKVNYKSNLREVAQLISKKNSRLVSR